ncbi:NfeD family protein [Gymnodinialimonas hymeniacidonis]|uniref:NfeD family protein n=1 Tax=Gymnodinialimonas hymeniacidonis TaxID=3126508 RepID=UPI0034C662A9
MDPFWSQWWVWGVAAVALAVGEVLLPSYVLLGFGVGAAIVALLLLIGVPLAASWPVMILVFAITSLIAWLLLRRVLGVYSGQVKTFDHDIND